MNRFPLVRRLVLVTTLALAAAACGDDDDAGDPDSGTTTTTTAPDEATPPTTSAALASPTTDAPRPEIGDPIPTPNPAVTNPPDAGSPFYQGVGIDLSLLGYEQSEFFVSGTARSFANVGDLDSDGRWAVEPAEEADYTTRIVVVRPSDPADFSGTVVMEWFNVTAGLDAAPNFTMSHVEQLRAGHAYVGVSAQQGGIEPSEGGFDVGFALYLKGNNPDRYGTLSHPGDSFSYDIFNQAAQAVRSPEPGGVDPLGGLIVEQMIATGESQSAFRLATYVNAIDPVAQLFDGYMIHSRSGGSANLSQEPQADIPTPDQVLVRNDMRVPVMTFQTETDLLLLGWPPDRQPDAENFVLWEVAGTAHSDVYSIALDVGPQDLGDNPAIAAVVEVVAPIPGIIECGEPINSGPQHYVMNAAIHALDRWVRDGERPTEAERLEVLEREIDPDAEGRQASYAAVTDENGNIRGGVRTTWVDVPVATLTGNPPAGGGYCGLFGTTALFDDAKLAELYPEPGRYIDAVTASIEQSVADGFILQADADLIIRHATDNPVGG